MLFYGVVSDSTEEAVELFTRREKAEAIVQAWDQTSPTRPRALHLEEIEFRRERRASRGPTTRVRLAGA